MRDSSVLLKFKGIELLLKEMQQRPDNGIISGEFNFNIKADSKVNEIEKLIIVFVSIVINDRNIGTEFGRLNVACAFEVENFETSIVKVKENLFRIPDDADALVKSVAISTTRGIMYSEFRGTYLFNAILPIIIINPPIPASLKTKKKAVKK
jgi:hypothetical protein